MPIRFPKEGNQYYPLPPDYPDLGKEAQRQARLNALMLQDTPEDLVNAWAFFREHYLQPPEVGWYKRWLPSPAMHYMIPYDMGSWSTNAWAAPRSFAKTTVVREMALLFLLTRKYFTTDLIQATEKKVRKSMGSFRRQLAHNPYINDDFSALWGPLKPSRGERSWNAELLELPNGSSIEGLSVNGALRGERPDLLLIDDPEYDEDEEEETRARSKVLEDFETLVFKPLLGMLDDGACLFWIGTLITRQSFLYHICKGDDPRFAHWNRRALAAEEEGNLLWEEKWNSQTLRDKKARLGESAYNSEMLNMPGDTSARILKIHPDFGTYRVEGDPPHQSEDPLSSNSILVYPEGLREGENLRKVETREPFGESVRRMFRMMTVDYAPTVKASSDFSCIEVLGLDQRNVLWVLDIYLEKVREDTLIRMIWELSQKWKVKTIGVEAISVQKHLADRIATELGRRSEGQVWRPRVHPLKYNLKHSKAERIQGLEWRFNQFKIRLPAHRMAERSVRDLWMQIENFTPDLSMLRWDDAIDTLAMQQYLVKQPGAAYKNQAPTFRGPMEALEKGELFDSVTGISHLSGLNASDLTPAAIKGIRNQAYGELGVREEEEEITWESLATKGMPFNIYR